MVNQFKLLLVLLFLLTFAAGYILVKSIKIKSSGMIVASSMIFFFFLSNLLLAWNLRDVAKLMNFMRERFSFLKKDYYAESDATNPLNRRVVTQTPPLPTAEQVTKTFMDCVQAGGEVKGCLTASNVAVYPEICSELCQSVYGKQDLQMGIYGVNPYCQTICGELMRQQRNSCSSGLC